MPDIIIYFSYEESLVKRGKSTCQIPVPVFFSGTSRKFRNVSIGKDRSSFVANIPQTVDVEACRQHLSFLSYAYRPSDQIPRKLSHKTQTYRYIVSVTLVFTDGSLDQQSCSTSSPVSTRMGNRLGTKADTQAKSALHPFRVGK